MKKEIKKIASFEVDHRYITPGIYISRKDGDITTYDMRTRRPNCGDYMDNITMQSLEHMFATFVRSSEIADDIIYFGPMGCQTGFYLLVRNADDKKVLEVIESTLEKIINHAGDVFGASEIECGNYKNLDINSAKTEANLYLDVLKNYGEIDFMYKGEKQ